MSSATFRSIRSGLVLSLVCLSAAASADQALIDYRQAVMDSIGGHTQALAAIIKGDVPYAEDASLHATSIEPLSKIAGHIFPPESSTGKTDALPAIWEKPEKFKEALTAFQTAAAELAKAADGEVKSLAAPFGNLAKTCKGCHDDFRKKN